MRRIIDLFLLAAALLAAAVAWRLQEDKLRAAGRTMRSRVYPCSSPVTCSIGAVDPRYNVTKEEVSRSFTLAEAAWEAAAGRELFALLPEGGDVTVNMVYDERQASMDKLKAIGLNTDRTLAAYKSLRERYDSLAAEAAPRQAALEVRLASYRRGEGAYNATVSEYNRRREVSAADQRRLHSARAALEREFARIKRQEAAVNADIDLLNALATTLNQLIVELKINVEQYKREGAALGMFEEGLYRVSGGVRTIDIYKYHDGPQLARLLAHELGHAAGLDHVADPEALMAPVDNGRELRLFPADLAELERACRPLSGRVVESWKAGARSLIDYFRSRIKRGAEPVRKNP